MHRSGLALASLLVVIGGLAVSWFTLSDGWLAPPSGVAGVAGAQSRSSAATKSTSVSVKSTASEKNTAQTPQKTALAGLRGFERARRASTDFLTQPASGDRLGSDPYRLASDSSGNYFGIARGSSELVRLGPGGELRARVSTARHPSGLDVGGGGLIYVVSELASAIEVFELQDDRLKRRLRVALPEVRGLRDVAAMGPGLAVVVEEVHGRLLQVAWNPHATELTSAALTPLDVLQGPLALASTKNWLVVNDLLGHRVRAYPKVLVPHGRLAVDPAASVEFEHDGPLWAAYPIELNGKLCLIAAGVEDKPLDRTIGSFGNIDSFLFVYCQQDNTLSMSRAMNLSELGVVTPKALSVVESSSESRSASDPSRSSPVLDVLVAGFATPDLLRLKLELPELDRLNAQRTEAVQRHAVTRHAISPGATALLRTSSGGVLIANSLSDRWEHFALRTGEVRAVDHPPAPPNHKRSESLRLGEVLFFTTLMAPANRSEGQLSRFTCETCHFEGYVDGRTHHTGRGNVRATTKPLLGLFNNKPHFSRALDKDLTQVAHAEFRVAGKNSGHDPWFEINPADHPWLAAMGIAEERLDPVHLRRALMEFLMEFSHRASPITAGRSRWSALERAGARHFQRRCESCHQAVASTDSPDRRQPFERWEALTFAPNAPLVWGSAEYHRTGVEPYVHRLGARVPSLRRLHKKRPYFTNGSARSLDELLAQVRVSEQSLSHQGGDGRALGPQERRELKAFLQLL